MPPGESSGVSCCGSIISRTEEGWLTSPDGARSLAAGSRALEHSSTDSTSQAQEYGSLGMATSCETQWQLDHTHDDRSSVVVISHAVVLPLAVMASYLNARAELRPTIV